MFTDLNPCYEFTDGAAFVVDDWKNIVDGTEVRIYVTSLMSEIEKGEKSAETVESLSSPNQIFLNTSTCPNLGASVTKINYITAKVSSDLVMGKANEELYKKYKKDPKNAKYITHIPRNSKLTAGDKVTAASDIGAIKDIFIY